MFTISLIVAFPTILEFLETHISSDGHLDNPSRVTYSIYTGLITLCLVLFLFKTASSRYPNQPMMAQLSFHIKLLYLTAIIFILLGILVSKSHFLFEEDGIIENLTALFSFGAAMIFFSLGLKYKKGLQPLFFFGMSGLLFFFAMEEISWGQRIIGWETPEAYKDINVQHETNVHNIFNQYFALLYLVFFTVVCLFFFIRKELIKIANKFTIAKPLVPFIPSKEFYYAGFILLFLFPFTIFFDQGGETLEPVFALLFFGYAYDLYKEHYKGRRLAAKNQ